MNFDTPVTKGEREIAKTHADVFYGLPQGGFAVLADWKDERVQFQAPRHERKLPLPVRNLREQLQENFERIPRPPSFHMAVRRRTYAPDGTD